MPEDLRVMDVSEAKRMRQQQEHICKIRPTFHRLFNLAAIYYQLGDSAKALELFRLINKDVPERADVLLNIGVCLRNLGRHEESVEALAEYWKLDHSKVEGGLAYTESLLYQGNWKEAWPVYDKCRPTKELAAVDCNIPNAVKMWDGVEKPELLLVLSEGGIGDRINYIRFLDVLTQRGINWKYFPNDPSLFSFYERLPWIGPDRLLKNGDEIPDPSHWTTIFSLMANLNISPEEVPEFPSPFTAAADADEKYKITRGKLPLVGICWQANELFQGGRRVRSMSEGQAMRLVCMTGDLVNWVNLQHDHKMPYPVANIPFHTWEDTAALIKQLDAVVSVDTGTMWMSAAMGKPTHVLLSSHSDWKFLDAYDSSERSVWGSNITLYRNGPSNDTEQSIEHAIDKLIRKIRENLKLFHLNGSLQSLASSRA